MGFGSEFNTWALVFNSQQSELSFQGVLVIETSSNASRLVSAWNKGSLLEVWKMRSRLVATSKWFQSHFVMYQQKRPRA